ncbi:glycosyltransferase family 39 protein [Microbacterium sp. SORGH_AS_0888]|uniref:ArnT family glycosyltransferase n=1 Tax=Microbacterium sp. SORGH_AS_0888 TaxID=3041791 RepID=UPI0027824F24|nr:glycosyltransferase family 39 protein [Microbacterium sp. SORGH_AS_0888]MDQ1128925.1 4-amino-4-deoxy-L-arabinose transferase-like glycosyltransferase [Microbacterium sp. SORGH_AS_0888]
MSEHATLPRWWRESWWARLTLAAILLAAMVLMSWNLARGGDFAFYEASARSMSESWKALFFGAFDPGATVTLDKLSGFAVPQALSLRLFGDSTSALALPQVVEGLVTVWACSLVALRWLGRAGGLLAAAAAASTPIFVSMFGHPMEDGLLTMSLAVALVWWQRAALTARWWPLLLAGLFVGIGFQAKMMQAWFLLPALALGTLLALGCPWGRRIGRAATVTGAAVVSSIAWMVVVELIPASSRPFVDGSTNDDVFAMVFGYNGIDRLLPNAVAGAVEAGGGAGHGTGPQDSFVKLLDPLYTTQIGWLYPAALAGIALGLWRWWPRRAAAARTPADRVGFASVVTLSVWLVTAAGVLSAARMPHTAYLAALGVQLTLLTALAAAEGLRLRRSPHVAARCVLPALILVQGVWGAVLAAAGEMPIALAAPMYVLFALGLLAAVAAAVRGPVPASRRGAPALAAAALIAVVAGPALFSAQVLDAARDGSGGDASVGVRSAAARFGEVSGSETPGFTISAPAMWGGDSALSTSMSQLLTDVRAHGGGSDGAPLLITDAWSVAAPLIDATGQDVLTDGGYSGQAEVFTEAQVRSLLASGEVHLVVVKDHAAQNDPVRQAVDDDACATVQSWESPVGEGPVADQSSHEQVSVRDDGDAASSARAGVRSRDADAGSRGGSSQALGFTLYSCP